MTPTLPFRQFFDLISGIPHDPVKDSATGVLALAVAFISQIDHGTGKLKGSLDIIIAGSHYLLLNLLLRLGCIQFFSKEATNGVKHDPADLNERYSRIYNNRANLKKWGARKRKLFITDS